jgi:hypothetical protein
MEVWAGLSLVEREAAERLRPRIVPASASAQARPVELREGVRVQVEVGRAQVKDALEEQMHLRMAVGAAGGGPMPETPVETAARGYSAALDRLQALREGGASDVDLRKAQMEANLARMLFDEARNPRRTASDPPPWAVGLGTFVEEFGKGALAVVSLGGTAAIAQALETGRLDGRSGFTDAVQIYFEGVFEGITFGAAGAYADARAGQGRSLLGSSASALAASLKNVSGYDDVKTIFADPHANAYDKAQAMATLVAKWAGLAALGISRTRYAKVEVPNPFRGRSTTGPGTVQGSGTIAPTSAAPDPIRWVDENSTMSPEARAYQSGAPGSRSNRVTGVQQAPEISYVNETGATEAVRFDGVEGRVLIDRKISVTTFPKSQRQALHQSRALKQHGLTGRWEVPTEAERVRAMRMFQRLGIDNIEVKVVAKS